MMLSLYIDSDGCAFVSIPTLAEDAELSAQTIRRRLVWLEEIGAVARVPQWIDAAGRRNGDQNGKRTTDLIMFLYSSDPDLIERRARGEQVAEQRFSPIRQTGLNVDTGLNSGLPSAAYARAVRGVNFDSGSVSVSPDGQQGQRDDVADQATADGVRGVISPTQQIGLNAPTDPVSPTPALRQPYHCGKGLISEPEPESSPLPPSRGRAADADSDLEEPEDFQPSWLLWPGREVGRRDLALDEFRLLAPDQQRLCRAAIPLYIAAKKRLGETHFPRMHIWIRTRGFEQFPDAKLGTEPSAQASDEHWIAEGSDDDRAFRFVCQLAKAPTPFVREHGGERGYFRKTPIGRDVVAMLRFVDQSSLRWPVYAPGTPQHAAWQQRFTSWVGKPLPHDPGHGGIRAPCEWPPRKDGTFFEGEAAQPSADHANAEGAR
ncbi:MAG: hypothetical protein J0H51_13070 [Rhizobiales bacterium]|nr:hypothetical protein [Hyphomicrobiales bacterium]